MKYQVKQKLVSVGDDFKIRDEQGKDVYFVDGHAFSFGKKLSFQDMQKKTLALIAQKRFTFAPTFHVKKNKRIIATVKKSRFSFRPRFTIDVPGTNDYTVKGDLFSYEFSIERGGRKAAQISKRFFSSTDSYGVEIVEGDTVLLLCSAIVIDMVLHN